MGSIYTLKLGDSLYEIVTLLRSLKFDSLEETLNRAVSEEADALLNYDRKLRNTAARRRSAYSAACDTYMSLINEFLQNPGYRVTPQDILHYRCKANAWAIAQLILIAQCGDVPFG